MVNCVLGPRVRSLSAPSLKRPPVPITSPGLPVPECVEPQTLFPSLVPSPLVLVPIGKGVHTISVHLVVEVLPGIVISIPASQSRSGFIFRLAELIWPSMDLAEA